MLVDDHTADSVNYGRVCDGPNYSCAYDSVIMVAFSTYRYADSSWARGWRDSSGFNSILGHFFENNTGTCTT